MPQLYAARVQPHLPGYKLCLGSVFYFELRCYSILKFPVFPQKPWECPLPD